MTASIKMVMVEIPKALTIHNIEKIKDSINSFSNNSLDIIRESLGDKAFEGLAIPDLSERLEEEHLFSLDEKGKENITSYFATKDFLEKAVDEIITPYLTGEDTSTWKRTIYKKIGTAHYAISFKEDFSYQEETDYNLIKAMKVSNILTGKF